MEYQISHSKGLVGFNEMHVPIDITRLTKSTKNRSFSSITNCCGDVVQQKKFCKSCNKDVTADTFVKKGVKIGKEMVHLNASQLKAVKDRLDTNKIVVEEFREACEIPIKYYSELLLAGKPVKKQEKAYTEYAKVLEATGKVAIGSAVVNSRPYPVIIYPENGAIMIRGLLYNSEVKDAPVIDSAPVNNEKIQLLSKVLDMQKFPAYDHSKFVNQRAEEEEKLIIAAANGEELPEMPSVDVITQAEDEEEIAKLKALVGE